jgi:hypothetical protein
LFFSLALAACSPTVIANTLAVAPPSQSNEAASPPFLFVDEPVIGRSGPGVTYPVTTEIPAQRDYRVIGKNVSWWLVDLGTGETAWVYGEINTTNFIGDPEAVPLAAAPPTPTPRPTPTCAPHFVATPEAAQALEEARATLAGFFQLLNAGQYQAAGALYAGDYEVLADINPLVGPDDHAGLLRNACEINGYQCLKLLRVLSESQASPVEFLFTVEFANPDGSTFVRGQCCGANETDMPSQSEFRYTVRMTCPGAYQVMELPVYVP